jgi:glycosyltransferase involved in cell wall biosynthesis
MSRILLVTQQTRSYGEFRRPWVRAIYGRYLERYRARVARVAVRLAREGELTLLAARELVEERDLPPGVHVRYYDAESFRVDSRELSRRNEALASAWWPTPGSAPELLHRGVWLPDLLTQVRGIVLQLEITEPLGIAEHVLQEVRPGRVMLVTGASTLEKLAGALARRLGAPVEVAEPGFIAARAYAAFWRALQIREERLRVAEFLDFPRRIPTRPARSGRRLLFVTCRPRHHFVVDPLTEAVRAKGCIPHVLATPTRDPELGAKVEGLRASGVTAEFLADYLPREDARDLVRRSRLVFSRLWRRLEGFLEGEGTPSQAGVPLGPLVRPLLRDTVVRSLSVALLFQEAAFRALDFLRPDAVILTSNRRYAERALGLAARQRGIPCLLFSGALLMGRHGYRFLDVADRLLVIGDHLRDGIVRQEGIPSRVISVVGDPRSNAAALIPLRRLREEVARQFGLDPDRPLLLLLSKYVSQLFTVREKEALYRTFLGALRALDGAQAVVKVHPNEDLATLSAQARDWGWPDAVLTKDYDIHRLFGAADATVMVTSMGGIEAMAMGCPVVAVQVAGKDYEGDAMPPYVSEGVVERVDMGDAAGLAAALARLLTDLDHRAALIERGRKFAARYVHPVDGALGDRLLAVVDEVRRDRPARGTP